MRRAAELVHLLPGCRDLEPVARQCAFQDGELEPEAPRVRRERAHVLRQARPAEREARPQVCGRDVELRVGAEELHELPAVHPHRLANAPDLVREADLQCVERVARELQELGLLDRDLVDGCVDALVRGGDHLAGTFVERADDGVRRRIEILHGARLAQELRVHGEPEVLARDASRLLLENLPDGPAHGAGKDGATDDDDVVAGAVGELPADLRGDPRERVQLVRVVRPARRPDADQRRVGPVDEAVRLARRPQLSGRDRLREDLVELRLLDGAPARADGLDLRRVRVDADDLVPGTREARCRYGADVSQPPDEESSRRRSSACWKKGHPQHPSDHMQSAIATGPRVSRAFRARSSAL